MTTTDPSAPPQDGERRPFDDRSLASAVGVLDLGREELADVAALTDEELLALDGTEAAQVAALPYLDAHPVDAETRTAIARTAMRSLMTRRLVVSEVDAAGYEERPLADDKLLAVTAEPRITGALVLRRTSRELVWFEREVSDQTHRLYYYPHDAGVVLEEEVTADGVHIFSVMPERLVPTRVRHLVDQFEIAGEDGVPRTISLADVETDPDLAPRIADTRALTVGTRISRVDDVAERAVFHQTSTEVIAAQVSADATEVAFVAVSGPTIEGLVQELLGGLVDEEPAPDAP